MNKIIRAAMEVGHMAAHGITFSTEYVTPASARAMLDANTGNRAIRRAVVAQMARAILAGEWRITHQGIAIAPCGRLLDGQHRLNAIVEAGIPVLMAVARNVPADSFAVIDGGGVSAGKRQLRDIMAADPRVLDPCVYVARLHMQVRHGGYVSADLAREPYHIVGPHVQALVDAAGKSVRGRSAAPIKAAAALRIMQGHGKYVIPQYTALVSLDYAAMSSATQALFRQLTDGIQHEKKSGSAEQSSRAARAWIAFDPSKAAVTRIQIKEISGHLSEMRAVWRPTWARSAAA
jgi:hypothetical protein